ncbi:hypothetical protein Tco_1336230 [Tanacetum coccineum]
MDISMREFKECVEEIEVTDVQCTGLQFTWNQKPKGRDGVLKKLDRILANLEFYDGFVVLQKLKALKKPLRKLLYDKGNLHTNVSRLRADLDRVQSALDSDPFSESLREEETNTDSLNFVKLACSKNSSTGYAN